MDRPNSPTLPSPVSSMSETATAASTSKTKTRGNLKSYISCRTSTGIPRDSFVTISSQSIIVFADVNDLPSRNGSQHSKIEEQNVSLKVETLDLRFKGQTYDSIESISSFGFDVAVPEPVQLSAPVKGSIDRTMITAQQIRRQNSFRPVLPSKSTRRTEHNLCESSPRPPSKGLLYFSAIFPTVAQDKQPVYVDKSLPPPPYHVFESKKKKGIMYLMAIVGVLTNLSTFIYFPALGNISRVSTFQTLF